MSIFFLLDSTTTEYDYVPKIQENVILWPKRQDKTPSIIRKSLENTILALYKAMVYP